MAYSNYNYGRRKRCRTKKKARGFRYVFGKDGLKIFINVYNDNPIAFNGGRNVGENYAERGGENQISWAGDDIATANRGGEAENEVEIEKAGRDLASRGGEID